MNTDLLIVALLAGAANWAFRVLPTRAQSDRLPAGGRLERFLAATGPAAIATLFLAAILPALTDGVTLLLPLFAGVGAVLAAWWLTRSVVTATLAGAVLHGATFWVVGLA